MLVVKIRLIDEDPAFDCRSALAAPWPSTRIRGSRRIFFQGRDPHEALVALCRPQLNDRLAVHSRRGNIALRKRRRP
jgi:hypothetical protein